MLNMKTAKFSNIILFITAIVMFFCAVMCNLGAMSVSADSLVTPKNYFTFTGDYADVQLSHVPSWTPQPGAFGHGSDPWKVLKKHSM